MWLLPEEGCAPALSGVSRLSQQVQLMFTLRNWAENLPSHSAIFTFQTYFFSEQVIKALGHI